jgi:hypothetical protein
MHGWGAFCALQQSDAQGRKFAIGVRFEARWSRTHPRRVSACGYAHRQTVQADEQARAVVRIHNFQSRPNLRVSERKAKESAGAFHIVHNIKY